MLLMLLSRAAMTALLGGVFDRTGLAGGGGVGGTDANLGLSVQMEVAPHYAQASSNDGIGSQSYLMSCSSL